MKAIKMKINKKFLKKIRINKKLMSPAVKMKIRIQILKMNILLKDGIIREITTYSEFNNRLVVVPTRNPDGSIKNPVFTENSLIVSSSYTVGTNRSAMAVGPITLNAGVTLTIPANSRLVIL
jgi:hypothetical protein